MSSPAERYAASRRRQAEQAGPLGRFRSWYDFPLDPFQEAGARALAEGRSVLVAAPTGAGKTVVGEFAVHLALETERKCFYTTPIKALSNQKYADLVRRYGPEQVGLLTGDNSVNGEAPVVVMTTEVLRNMLYAGSPTLLGLGYVVLDEVHYLADRERGAVWEEVIIHLPESVQLACLSATVSNAEEFGEWLGTVRGPTDIVVEEHRPVPLWQHVLVGTRLVDLFVERRGRSGEPARRVVNPELVRLVREEEQAARMSSRSARGRELASRSRRGRGPERSTERRVGTRQSRTRPPTRPQLVDRLARADLLPAIVFVFSRAGTDAAVEACLRSGVRLTSDAEREQIRAIVDARCAGIAVEDLALLGYTGWRDALERGVASHHAGMLPTFKETVEELFTTGLVKVVFATETLALGINMPARSVVLDRLVKWNGQTHAEITPGEYTQLTGRAGRRGIDVEGHAIVVWTPGMDPQALAGLASTRTYPLRSSFRPSYNMAVNLVARLGRAHARRLLETSFAQFQADRSVVGLARQVAQNEEALAGYREAMTCERGDIDSYVAAYLALREAESAGARQSASRAASSATRSLARLRAAVTTHPVHRCPDRGEHLRWALRYQQLRAQTDTLVARITRRRDTVGRTFDRVLAVLDAVDYLDGERVTPPGQRLARLYGELDLVAAECLREQLWVGLSPPDLAACVAALVYSGRHPDDAPPARLPSGRVRDVLAQMVQLWGDLAALEDDYDLDLLRPMDLGLTWAVWRWAQGGGLGEVLAVSDVTAGDFVRWVRQVIDLLGQVADAAGEQDAPLAQSARAAVDAIRRGVVAYSSVG